MAKAEQYKEIILQTKEWFDKKIEKLQLTIDKKNEYKILFEGENGEKVELPEELKKGFFMGIEMAIEVLGKFPVNVTKTDKSNNKG